MNIYYHKYDTMLEIDYDTVVTRLFVKLKCIVIVVESPPPLSNYDTFHYLFLLLNQCHVFSIQDIGIYIPVLPTREKDYSYI